MMKNFTDAICNNALKSLPKIEGVKWKVHSAEIPGIEEKIHFSVVASFEIDKRTHSAGDLVDKVAGYLHAITSDGQVLLHLERF